MKNKRFLRTELLIGSEGIEKLRNSKIAIFGVGGVGSYSVEALARCGVGKIVLVDYDKVCITNINRQIHATSTTIGEIKVKAMKDRILDINPDAEVVIFNEKYISESANKLLSDDYDYVIDAIDMVSSKIDLIVKCKERGIKIISSMGAGNKMDPTKFEVSDIFKTEICPLARVLRKELRKKNVSDLKVVYSKEIVSKTKRKDQNIEKLIGSISFVPSVVGLILASVVAKEIIEKE
ncbi:MAG: tRNA cyclic N6-threonylcarbamoyladenosine(37) synthase TcdA [Alkaliphilus sp.]|nr:tRNA threonylcarbamoyladenosine dehydratase [bacterium AH-315-G05]MBN4074728.1 tRNA threonylcarbamoyladenosine dehydratase [bacterium AH-315-E09]PHS36413.1 MAG: tRNA cyclic N6-threonylcarbamoyladenosine(37) synthase TcdA [Alkaliphilus sp.]